MHLSTLLLFCAVAFIAIATPGPTVLLALANGSRHGLRLAACGMLGAVCSDFILVGAVALGLGALLATSEFWFNVLKWAGAVYLAWLGLMLLRSKGTLGAVDISGGAADGKAVTGRSLFLKCFLVAVTNPKGYLFCSALLPQFISPTEAQWPQYLVIGLLFATLDFIVMAAYAAAGARAMRLLKARGALWLDRACGGALLALAGSLALYRRGAS
jgi:threonine/homoserine/homoserine lactone efflux protein